MFCSKHVGCWGGGSTKPRLESSTKKLNPHFISFSGTTLLSADAVFYGSLGAGVVVGGVGVVARRLLIHVYVCMCSPPSLIPFPPPLFTCVVWDERRLMVGRCALYRVLFCIPGTRSRSHGWSTPSCCPFPSTPLNAWRAMVRARCDVSCIAPLATFARMEGDGACCSEHAPFSKWHTNCWLGCVFNPAPSKCWVQNTSRIQNFKVTFES